MRRIPTWLVLMLAAVGPSVAKSAPSPQWAGVVEKTRQIVRATVAQQNLPGLSLAIGVDGDIVWAEGFGFADLKNSVPVTPDNGSPRPEDRFPWISELAIGVAICAPGRAYGPWRTGIPI